MKKKPLKRKIVEHIKGDIETFKHESHEDKELLKTLVKKKKKK